MVVTLEISPGSEIAKILIGFSGQDWINLLGKCKSFGIGPEEITTSTSGEGDTQILSAETQETLDKMMAFIREVEAERKK